MSSASVSTYSRNSASTVPRSSGQRASAIDSKPSSPRNFHQSHLRRSVAPAKPAARPARLHRLEGDRPAYAHFVPWADEKWEIRMADSRQFIDEFLIDLPNHGRKWKNFAVNPFAKAYVAARKAYDDMAKAQADADSETPLGLKLALLALSLCGGGAMTAAFGTTALKTIASNAAVAVICRRNMDKAFTAANFIATNKTASFVAGKLWDEIENGATGFLGNKFKPTDLAQNPAAFPSVNKFVQ